MKKIDETENGVPTLCSQKIKNKNGIAD